MTTTVAITDVVVRDGSTVCMRQAEEGDELALVQFLLSLSPLRRGRMLRRNSKSRQHLAQLGQLAAVVASLASALPASLETDTAAAA
jgi:hypothetical protein